MALSHEEKEVSMLLAYVQGKPPDFEQYPFGIIEAYRVARCDTGDLVLARNQ